MNEGFEFWLRKTYPAEYTKYYEEYTSPVTIGTPFDDFWEVYEKKTGKHKCEAKWNRIGIRERSKIVEHAKEYVKATPNRQYRMNPLTYLNGKYYNDEDTINAARERLRSKTGYSQRTAGENGSEWAQFLHGQASGR